ncbi:hypothetical protein [Oceanotoga teriensis]|uniref:hypothetical protein n=1 Tax=Oceanotoga teriensis TaxID=515440 RepID=UPI0027130F8D|nr:hypothetical protein [Oceanotoga teriensis]MDO7977814.1 hypothetical protein [Oceanotoga teriensis]
MEINKKLKILSKIGKELNNAHITWAIGASLLLYLKGFLDDFQDIDIIIAEKDISKTKKILLKLGKLEPENPNIKYKTKKFLEFKVDCLDIDIIAGFTIVNNNQNFYFPLKQEDIKDYIEINGINIPLQSVNEWRNYYSLMGRTEKVKIIDDNIKNYH